MQFFISVCLVSSNMESFTAGYMFGNDSHTTHVVERSSRNIETASFEIPIDIVDRVMDNRYTGVRNVGNGSHP